MYHIVKVHPVIPDVRSRRQERGFPLSLLSVLLISVPVQSRCMPVAGDLMACCMLRITDLNRLPEVGGIGTAE